MKTIIVGCLVLLVALVIAKAAPKPAVKAKPGSPRAPRAAPVNGPSVQLQVNNKKVVVPQQCLENAVKLCASHDTKNEETFGRFAYATAQINQVKAAAKQWQPRHNKFSTTSLEKMKYMNGVKPVPPSEQPKVHKASTRRKLHQALPDEFDSRKKWPDCISPILDQGHCGSCWAFAGATVLNDRICIQGAGKGVKVSIQDQISCNKLGISSGCDGGSPIYFFKYANLTGVVGDSCNNYKSAGNNGQPDLACPANCDDGKTPVSATTRYHSTMAEYFKSVNDIKTEIMTNGPVTMTINVYSDLMFYSKGVYSHAVTKELGLHGVRCVGWGKDKTSGKNYWIIANSWGTSWGQDGYVWLAEGDSLAESQIVAAKFTKTGTGPAATPGPPPAPWTTIGPKPPGAPVAGPAVPAAPVATNKVVSPWTTLPLKAATLKPQAPWSTAKPNAIQKVKLVSPKKK